LPPSSPGRKFRSWHRWLAALAARFAERLLERGVYVIGFSYPVVPMGKARIRTQMCAGHTLEQLDRAIEGFVAVGRELGIIH